MNRAMDRDYRRASKRKLSRATMILAVLVMFSGLFAQIYIQARIAGQNKAIAAVQKDIKTLAANAENLTLSINQHHNLEDIGQRAAALGMAQPDESQLRVVSLPIENTSTQTVANTGSEEMNG